jgi:ParB family chromosome partitioning protein
VSRRGGLGKGLGALIPTGPPAAAAIVDAPVRSAAAAAVPSVMPSVMPPVVPDPAPEPERAPGPAAVPGASFRELPVDAIRPNPRQPRQVFDEESQDELKASIKEFGLLQPVVVRPVEGDAYEMVMGERRWRATRDLGLATIPAIVRDTADDAMLRDALLENLHRVQLNPLEEAAAYRQLLDEFGTTHEELAQRIGRSRSQVTNTVRLLNLPVPVQRRVAAGVLSAGHARALLALDDPDAQDALASRIVAEGLSVRAVEELVALAGHEKPAASRAPRGQRVTAPALTDLADRLSDSFDTRVKVELGRRKGKIVVEFASVDDLERIVGLMAPGMGPRPSGFNQGG